MDGDTLRLSTGRDLSALHDRRPSNSSLSSFEGELETVTSMPKAHDLSRAKLSKTKYSLYNELRKTEGTVSAFFKQFSISAEANELIGRVTAKPSKEQTIQATMMVRMIKEAKSKPTYKEALLTLEASMRALSEQYPTLAATFDTGLVKEAQKELFLPHARKAALSQTELEEITECLGELENPPTAETLVEAYVNDPVCQANTERKLRQLNSQVRELEASATEIKKETIVQIERATLHLSKAERAYFKAADKADQLAQSLVGPEARPTEEDMDRATALFEQRDRLFEQVVEAKEQYDEVTSYARFLNQHVDAVSSDLEEINLVKEEFENYKAPFIGTTSRIAHIYTTPRINDAQAERRLPGLRTFDSITQSLERAIYAKDRVLASRIYYELGEYNSPVARDQYENTLQALLAEVKGHESHGFSSAEEVFKSFFEEPNETSTQLIISALRSLKQKARS